MCGRYGLTTEYEKLPSILKKNLPKGFEKNYSIQQLIKPSSPVIVLKNEGKISTSLMLWGFISEWAKDPFDTSRPRPINARAETIEQKNLFKGSWKHKRCLLPATFFLEKGHYIRKKNYGTFWLGGIWNKWMNAEGSEIETCCILTTKANKLIQPLHGRMPVIIPNGLEEKWIEPVKNIEELREIKPFLNGWNSDDWLSEPTNPPIQSQMCLF